MSRMEWVPPSSACSSNSSIEGGGRFLVLATDYGPFEVTGPAFEELLATIEVKSDTAAAR